MTGLAKNTITKLLVDLGAACEEYQDGVMQNLTCRRSQCDEIWSFVGAKEKRPLSGRNWSRAGATVGRGLPWTPIRSWVPCWAVGGRTVTNAVYFLRDLASRLSHRFQLTTDRYRPYLTAVDRACGEEIDYGILVKIYGNDPKEPQRRYSSGSCIGAEGHVIKGDPEWGKISTSYVERQNLTMRMGMRRLTRLTNAFRRRSRT